MTPLRVRVKRKWEVWANERTNKKWYDKVYRKRMLKLYPVMSRWYKYKPKLITLRDYYHIHIKTNTENKLIWKNIGLPLWKI